MFLGASSSARKNGPQFVDLNLVPREYRATGFPVLTVGLVLLVVGGLILSYALFYAKTYGDLEVAALSKRVAQAQSVVQTATANPAALAQAKKKRSMLTDYQVLEQRQINWGNVLQVVGATPSGVTVKEVSQAGFGVTITGSASDQAAVARYLDQLKNSGLFINAALQTRPGSVSAQATTFSPTAVPTSPPTRPPPSPAAVAPVLVPTPLPTRPLPVYRPPTATPVPVKVASPTITRTPTITSTPSPSPSPTSAYDFALLSSQQLPLAKQYAATSDIRGKVVDLKNNPVPGITLEIDSDASSTWTAQTTTGADGTFDFSVTHGKFQVFVVGGSSQSAQDLYTGADGVAQVYDYQLVFQKTFSGSTPPNAGSPTATATATNTITPSPSPISFGANVASKGCASASDNSGSANQATDNNLGTEWNAGRAPSAGNPVWWKWVLPQKLGDAGCNAAGLPDDQLQIEAFQLIPDQNPAGNTVHELWLYSDPLCSQNLQTGGGPYYTFQQSTSAGQILSLKLSTAIGVRCVIIDTLADPSSVAWQEIQIYQTPQPPTGFPTFTPTASPISEPTAVPTTGTPTVVPTATLTVTPTYTPLPLVNGTDIAPSAIYVGIWQDQPSGTPTGTPVALTNCKTPVAGPTPAAHSDPCVVISPNPSDYWAPSKNSTSPQGVTISVWNDPAYRTDRSIVDVRFTIESQDTSSYATFAVLANHTPSCSAGIPTKAYPDQTQIDCPISPPVGGSALQTISVLIYQNGTEDGTYGIRNIQIFQEIGVPTTPTVIVNRVKPVGGGRGPGVNAAMVPTSVVVPIRPIGQPTASSPANQPAPQPSGPSGPPVDFTIVLELASGQGYGK